MERKLASSKLEGADLVGLLLVGLGFSCLFEGWVGVAGWRFWWVMEFSRAATSALSSSRSGAFGVPDMVSLRYLRLFLALDLACLRLRAVGVVLRFSRPLFARASCGLSEVELAISRTDFWRLVG